MGYTPVSQRNIKSLNTKTTAIKTGGSFGYVPVSQRSGSIPKQNTPFYNQEKSVKDMYAGKPYQVFDAIMTNPEPVSIAPKYNNTLNLGFKPNTAVANSTPIIEKESVTPKPVITFFNKAKEKINNIKQTPSMNEYLYKLHPEWREKDKEKKEKTKEFINKSAVKVADVTSNLPLKWVAANKATLQSEKELNLSPAGWLSKFENNYKTLLEDRNNVNNGHLKKFLYDLQDSGTQSLVGMALTVASGIINPSLGTTVGGAYYSALSADEQIKEKGKIYSKGNIAIDTLGDIVIGKILGKLFITGSKNIAKELIKNFNIEGGTEVAQSIAKYANNYRNTKEPLERQKIAQQFKSYLKDGVIQEYLIGGITSMAGTGGVTAMSKVFPSAASMAETNSQKYIAPGLTIKKVGREEENIKKFKEFKDRLFEGKTTPEEIKTIHKELIENEDKIKEELNQLTKEQLMKMGVSYMYKNDSKARIVDAAYSSMKHKLTLHKNISYSPFEKGSLDKAVEKIINEITEDDIVAFKNQVEENTKAYKETVEKTAKAIKNPETLEDFEIFIRYLGKSKMTPEQQEKYDDLRSTDLREKAKIETEKNAKLAAVDIGNTEMKVEKTRHTKKDVDIFVVKLSNRITKEAYQDLNTKAKRLGGYYSRWSKGFIFEDETKANNFTSIKNADIDISKDILDRQEETKDNAAERMLEMAENMEKKAEEELSRERKTNTARRAGFAEGAERQAQQNKAMAKTMRKIGEALKKGEANHLSGLRTRTQIELLERYLTLSKYERIRELQKTDSDAWHKHENDPISKEDIPFIKFPIKKIPRGQKDNWHYKEQVEQYKRLARAGINTIEQLRAALRELINIREEAKEVDPIKKAERELVGLKIDGYWDTRGKTLDDLIDKADLNEENLTILEPSAGKGNIADRIKAEGYTPDVIEINYKLRSVLELKGYNIVGDNFLEFNDKKYDRIIMNPPFENLQDVDHVKHAYELLKPGGKVIAIMGEAPFFRSDKKAVAFREWLDEVGGESEKLPENSFKGFNGSRDTGVNARVVEITKVGENAYDRALEKVNNQIDNLNKKQGYGSDLTKHFHLGMVGGSGKNVQKLNEQRANSLDKTIDNAVKLVKLYKERDEIAKEKERKETGYYEKQAEIQKRKEQKLIQYWLNLKVGDEIYLGNNKFTIKKKNPKSLVLNTGTNYSITEIIGINAKDAERLIDEMSNKKNVDDLINRAKIILDSRKLKGAYNGIFKAQFERAKNGDPADLAKDIGKWEKMMQELIEKRKTEDEKYNNERRQRAINIGKGKTIEQLEKDLAKLKRESEKAQNRKIAIMDKMGAPGQGGLWRSNQNTEGFFESRTLLEEAIEIKKFEEVKTETEINKKIDPNKPLKQGGLFNQPIKKTSELDKLETKLEEMESGLHEPEADDTYAMKQYKKQIEAIDKIKKEIADLTKPKPSGLTNNLPTETPGGIPIEYLDFNKVIKKNGLFGNAKKEDTKIKQLSSEVLKVAEEKEVKLTDKHLQAIDDYIAKAKKENKPLIADPDEFKYIFNNDFNQENHKYYSIMALEVFYRGIHELNDPTVKFTAGSPGSAKSDVLRPTAIEDTEGFKGVIYDGTLSDLESTLRNIELAKKAGRNIEIYAIISNPETAWYYIKKREAEGKHHLPLDRFIKTYLGFRRTMKYLSENTPENVKIKLLDIRLMKSLDNIQKEFLIQENSKIIDIMSQMEYNEEKLFNKLNTITYDGKAKNGLQQSTHRQEHRSGGIFGVSQKDKRVSAQASGKYDQVSEGLRPVGGINKQFSKTEDSFESPKKKAAFLFPKKEPEQPKRQINKLFPEKDITKDNLKDAQKRLSNLEKILKADPYDPNLKLAVKKVQNEVDLLKAKKTYTTLGEALKKKIKPDIEGRTQKVIEKEIKLEIPKFEGELEYQYEEFKKALGRIYGSQIAFIREGAQDSEQLKEKAKKFGFSGERIDNMLYSQDKSNDEVLDLFRERISKEKENVGVKSEIKKEKSELNQEEKAREKLEKIQHQKEEEYVKGEYAGFQEGYKEGQSDMQARINARRIKVRSVRDYFKLTDEEIRSINRRDIRYMDDKEYQDFINQFEKKAMELAKTKQAKIELLDHINRMELKRVENLQQAMKLPHINKMTNEQLAKFIEAIKPFQFGDEFLSVRKLETIDNTNLKGVKTFREARIRLAEELKTDPIKIANLQVKDSDKISWDTVLADQNPFYKWLVDKTNENLMQGEANYFTLENETNELVKKARKSRKGKLGDILVPQDKHVFAWLEADNNDKVLLSGSMTKEELDLAYFLQNQYAKMRDRLIERGAMKKFRENYITHIRKKFLETYKDDGFIQAFTTIFEQYTEDWEIFKILEGDTGEILPLEKFFRYTMRRTGGIKPTKNVARAFLGYAKLFETKEALDNLVPHVDTYLYVLSSQEKTGRGLQKDRTLQRFVYEWLNNKKGRTASKFLTQGSKYDLIFRGLKMFTSIMDMGLSPITQGASYLGEFAMNFQMMGNRKTALGISRGFTNQGKMIVKKYQNFVGKNAWAELAEASKDLGDQTVEMLFIGFRDSAYRANKIYLLGNLTEEEFKTGEISKERLAEMKRLMGEFRVIPGSSSLYGSTTEGKIITQYKTWAIAALRGNVKNLTALAKTFKTGKVDKKALAQTFRALEIIAAATLIFSLWDDDDDKSFLGKLRTKAKQELMSTVTAANSVLTLPAPRLGQYLIDLGDMISQLLFLHERYKSGEHKGELKGVVKLLHQITPAIVRQAIDAIDVLTPEKKTGKKLNIETKKIKPKKLKLKKKKLKLKKLKVKK